MEECRKARICERESRCSFSKILLHEPGGEDRTSKNQTEKARKWGSWALGPEKGRGTPNITMARGESKIVLTRISLKEMVTTGVEGAARPGELILLRLQNHGGKRESDHPSEDRCTGPRRPEQRAAGNFYEGKEMSQTPQPVNRGCGGGATLGEALERTSKAVRRIGGRARR